MQQRSRLEGAHPQDNTSKCDDASVHTAVPPRQYLASLSVQYQVGWLEAPEPGI